VFGRHVDLDAPLEVDVCEIAAGLLFDLQLNV
jgi:hypothetical protein